MKKVTMMVAAALAMTALQAPVMARAADSRDSVAQEQQMEMRKQEILLKLRLAQTQLKQLDNELNDESNKALATSVVNSGLRGGEAYLTMMGLKDLILGFSSKNREEMIRGLNKLIKSSAMIAGHEAYLKEVAVRAKTEDEKSLKTQREQLKQQIADMNTELTQLANNVK